MLIARRSNYQSITKDEDWSIGYIGVLVSLAISSQTHLFDMRSEFTIAKEDNIHSEVSTSSMVYQN